MSRISRRSSYQRLDYLCEKIGHYSYILLFVVCKILYILLVLSDIKFVYILIYMYMHVLFKVLFIIG